jgi:protein-tyrosine-phosphatase
MAEGFLNYEAKKNKLDIHASSAGTHAFFEMSASENSIDSMKKYNIDISEHKSKTVTKELIEKFDLILGMTDEHSQELIKKFPCYKEKIYTFSKYVKENLDIADPYGASSDVYMRQCDQIKFYIEKLIKIIL